MCALSSEGGEMDKFQEAISVIERARKAGCVATITGDWVVWKPALPIDILMDAVNVNKEIAEIVRQMDVNDAFH